MCKVQPGVIPNASTLVNVFTPPPQLFDYGRQTMAAFLLFSHCVRVQNVLSYRGEFMQPFRYHILLCTQQKPENVPCCAANGANQVLAALQEQLAKQNLANEVIVSTTGCLGACEHGPVMIVYPDSVWYGAVRPSDVAEIVSAHLKDGHPVERLMINDDAALRNEILDHRAGYRAVMEEHDRSGVLPEELLDQIRGFWPSRALLTALELDIFTAVGNGGSAAEIASRLDTDPRATEMLLNVLVSFELLSKGNGTFRNEPTAVRYFCAGSPDNAQPGLLHQVHLWDSWSKLTECVRTGGPASLTRRERDEKSTRDFIAAMERNSRERSAQLVHAVGTEFTRMLDLGGGSGAYSIAFAKANPHAQFELLDVPSVVPLTQQYVQCAGLESRIRTRAGDMLTDEFGEGYNLVLLSAIAHMFSPEENRSLLARIYRALSPNGRFVLQDFILNSDKTSPKFGALFSLNMLVNTRGGADYSEPEYREWLSSAGFREVRRVPMPGPSDLIIATK